MTYSDILWSFAIIIGIAALCVMAFWLGDFVEGIKQRKREAVERELRDELARIRNEPTPEGDIHDD
jgi:hypothetical protein